MPTPTVLRDPQAMHSLAPQWHRLHHSLSSDNPFVHPAWCISWGRAYSAGEVRVVVHRDGDDELVGLIALAPKHDRRTWTTLGVPLVDCGEPLLPSGDQGPQTLLDLLTRCDTEWAIIELVGLREEFARTLVQVGSRYGVTCHAVASEVCPRIAIPSFEQWRRSLPVKRWVRLAANRRRIEDRLGARFREVRDPAELPDAIRRFESLRLQSWWARRGFRALPPAARCAAHTQLLCSAATHPLARGAVSVVQLSIGERLVSSSVLFWTADSVLVALKATDTRLGSAYSPGLALDLFTIELAASWGAVCVGFGRGDESYKFTLGAAPKMTTDIVIERP